MKSLRYISDIISKNKLKYLSGIIFIIIVDTLQLVMPAALGNITDLLKSGRLDKNNILLYSLLFVAIAVGIAAFRFLWRYMIFGVSKTIETELRSRFYKHIQELSSNYFNSHKTGDLMAHATNDINNVSGALGFGITLGIDSTLIPIAAIIMMIFTTGIKITLVASLPLIVLAGIMVIFVKYMHERIEKVQESFSTLTERAQENFSGIRVIKSFVQEQKEIEKFCKTNQHNREMNMRFVRLYSMMFPLVMTVSAFSFAIALWYGGIQVMYGNITLGNFVAFNSYLGMLIWPIAALGWITSIFQRGSVSLKRINTIMDEKPEIKDPLIPAAITHICGKINIRNLNFTYPGSDKPVLKNIAISVEEGKTLAIVGRTGSGKTTVINLLQRLYNVEEGTIFIDDIDINKIPLSVLRAGFGCVPQDTFLFSATIGENIDFFHGADKESTLSAAKLAIVYDNIMEFPKGFDTLVGERGVTLSGGQKQRVAIARAVLINPKVLLLDDCLSAVDTRTEEEILRGLKEVMKGRTSIIVSHRISTIKDADEIIVLDEGEIIERGNHEALLQEQGTYFELYQKQLLAEQLEEAE